MPKQKFGVYLAGPISNCNDNLKHKGAQFECRVLSRLLAVAVALQAAVIEPMLKPLSLVIWEIINFTIVIALSFGAGLLRRRS